MKKIHIFVAICFFPFLCNAQNKGLVDYNDTIDYIRNINIKNISDKQSEMYKDLYFNKRTIFDTLGADSVQVTYYKNKHVGGIIPYKKGKVNGYCEFYYYNGQLSSRLRFINGEPIDGFTITFNIDGSIYSEGYIKNGKRNGIWYIYVYGYLSQKIYYKNGIEVQNKERIWNNVKRKWEKP